MKRSTAFMAITAMILLGFSFIAGSARGQAPGPNGQIAFNRDDPTVCRGCGSDYTVNPDGTHERKLFAGAGSPRWSPDGTEVAVFAGCSFGASCATVIVNPDTRTSRVVPNLQPSLINQFFACLVWSPDGARLACVALGDAFGVGNVIYTIRSSDGGDLTKVLSCPEPEHCDTLDWSPEGKRLLIDRVDPSGQRELFTVKLDGTGLRQITPSPTIVDTEDDAPSSASWSPTGNHIVFVGQADPDHRRGIFEVNADGSALHEVTIPGCGGAFSDPRSVACWDPSWSPDGTKIVFARGVPTFGTTAIYTANADGTGLSQVTTATNLYVSGPDWGPHRLAA